MGKNISEEFKVLLIKGEGSLAIHSSIIVSSIEGAVEALRFSFWRVNKVWSLDYAEKISAWLKNPDEEKPRASIEEAYKWRGMEKAINKMLGEKPWLHK